MAISSYDVLYLHARWFGFGGRAEDGPWYTLSREKVRYTKKEEDRRRATVNLNGPLSWELVL
jgi:hypothetical protein